MISNLAAVSGLNQPTTDSTTTPQPRLVKAAHEFEAQMMKELLKPLSSSTGMLGSDDDADTGSNGALGEFASESLGQALSNHGGLGLSNRIIQDVTHRASGQSQASGAALKSLHETIALKPLR
jgi:Rod binding domain-containing protein